MPARSSFSRAAFLSMPPAYPVRLPFAPHDPMAWDDEGNPVAPHGAADGPGGRLRTPALRRQTPGNLAVGDGLPVGNRQKELPDRHAERRADGMQRRREGGLLPGEVDIQPARGGGKRRGRLLLMFCREIVGEELPALEPQARQPDLVRRQQDAAQRRGVFLDTDHFPLPTSAFI